MSGEAYGETAYGGDPYLVPPDASPIAVSYGDEAYGSFTYGGGAKDNTIGGMIVRVTEPVAVVEATMTISAYSATFAVTEPAVTVEAEMVISSYPLSAGATESVPVVSGEMVNPSLGCVVFEPMPDADAELLSGSVLLPDVTEQSPDVYGEIVEVHNITCSVTENIPTVNAEIVGESFTVAATDYLPTADGWMETFLAIAFATEETKPLVSSQFTTGGFMSVQAIEVVPVIAASINGDNFNTVEPKPIAQAGLIAGRVITGSAKEAKPTAQVTMQGESAISVSAKEPKPAIVATMTSGAGMVAAVTEAKPVTQSVMVRGNTVQSNVVDIAPLIAARIGQDGMMAGVAVEPKPSVAGQLVNLITVEVNEGDPTAWTINTQVMASTEYDKFLYKSMCCVGGKCYGIRDDGLYLLTGENDNGTVFNSAFLTGETDGDEDRLKRVLLLHADVEGDVQAVVHFDGTETAVPFIGRAKFGKGSRANRLAFGMKSVDGDRFKIRSLEPVIEVLRKRSA